MLLLFSAPAFCQETPVKRFIVGLNFSLDHNYRTLKNNDGSSSSDVVIDVRNESEVGKLGFTSGLNVRFDFTKFFGLETGIQYSIKGYQTKEKDLFWPAPNPTAPTKGKFISNYHYIDIPVKANFTFGSGRTRFFSSIGLTTNVFIKETQTTVLKYADNKKDKDTQPTNHKYNSLNLSPMIGVGLDYKINDRTSFRIEPTFRYGVLKLIDSPVAAYLWNGGLNLSYYFGL